MRQLTSAQGIGFLIVLVTGLVVGILLRASTFDDPWITYRVAENLAAGNGFVYNQGEQVMVTTSPLYTLVLGALSLIGLDVPATSTVISILAFAISGTLMFLILAPRVPVTIAMAAGLLYVLFPLFPTTFGMETNFYMALALGSVGLLISGKSLWAAALLALATLTRMDAITLAAPLLLYQIIMTRRFPYRETLIYAGLCIPWFVFSMTFFGSLFPNTLAAKTAQLSLGWFSTFLPGATDYFQWAFEPAAIRVLLLALLLLGLAQGIIKDRFLLPVIGWGLLYVLSYQKLAVPFYHWYLAPAIPAVLFSVALGLNKCLELLRQQNRTLTSALVVVLLSAPFWTSSLARDGEMLRSGPDGRMGLYREVGEWLDINAGSGAVVEAMEIGVIGYYSKLPIVDFAGLTSPQVAKRLERQDLVWSVFHFWPEFVVLLDENPFDQYLASNSRFTQFYSRVKRLSNPNSSIRSLSIFRLWNTGPDRNLASRNLGNRFGTVEIEKIELEYLRVNAGDDLRLGLYWRPTTDLERDYSTFVHLVDDNWKTYAQSDNVISTTQWEGGKTYKDFHILRAPRDIPLGTYWLNIGMYQANPFENLKTKGEDGLDTTSLRVFQVEVVAPTVNAVSPGPPQRNSY
ncbi:MAG: hypothetical protein Q8O86_10135 [Dehalococcoidia bacterium]|nr:hypothetical protein [Dehalococcoidia bacterium]